MTKIKERLIICGLLVLGSLFLCGWTYTLRTNTPAGTDDPTEADDRMREIKSAFVERLDIDHYFTLSATSTYDAADCGKHRFITFREPNDLTVMAADESALFSKNVSSVTELHWIDESDNVLQLTSGGEILFSSLSSVANNTYFTAVDFAGTGTVDLIKADANDVAVVPDNSQTATNAAPTSTTGIANKKYVDDWGQVCRMWCDAAAVMTQTAWTKIPFETDDYDPDGISDTSNNRIVPDKAGYYQVNAGCYVSSLTGGSVNYAMAIYKNGAAVSKMNGETGQAFIGCVHSDIVHCNGSTDYIEVFFYNGHSTNPGALSGLQTNDFLSVARIDI